MQRQITLLKRNVCKTATFLFEAEQYHGYDFSFPLSHEPFDEITDVVSIYSLSKISLQSR